MATVMQDENMSDWLQFDFYMVHVVPGWTATIPKYTS